MKLDEFRREMEAYWRRATEEARRAKDPFLIRKRLLELYRRFDEHERLMANQVIGECVLSEDEGVRFDAVGLIKDLKIVSAVPSLQLLAERLSREQSPGAPFELEKVERIIRAITLASSPD
jgi:hypothetical protein